MKKEKVLFFLVLIIAVFFRFYDFSDRISLSEDTSRDVLVAIEGAREFQLPLTGPFSSVGQFTFGPWYYYFLILFNFFLRTIYASWWYSGLTSIAFVLIMYKIGEMIEGKFLGLLVSVLAALSPPQISTSTTLLNPNLISFYSGLSILFFLKAIKKRLSFWQYLLFGMVLGIGISHHYQMAGLLILPLILFVFRRFRLKNFLTIGGGLFLAFLPLLFFELNNHWYTLKNMFYYATIGKKAIYIPNRWLFYVRDFWPDFWAYCLGVPPFVGGAVIVLFSLIIAILFIKKRLSLKMSFLLFAFGVNFVTLRYYWGERNYGYFQYLYPFIFAFSGYLLRIILKLKWFKYLGWLAFSAILVLAIKSSIGELKPNPWFAEMRRQADMIEKAYPEQKYVLLSCQGKYKVRDQAVTYILASRGKLDDSGIKIGLKNPDCALFQNKKTVLPGLIPDSEAYDFSQTSRDLLLSSGWSPISPKIVYDSTVRWWFNEKP